MSCYSGKKGLFIVKTNNIVCIRIVVVASGMKLYTFECERDSMKREWAGGKITQAVPADNSPRATFASDIRAVARVGSKKWGTASN